MPDDYDAEAGMDAPPSSSSWCSKPPGADRERVLGVGMGLPGPVHRSGVVGSSAILPGWAGTHAAERMGDRLGHAGLAAKRRQPRRARRGHLGRRPRRLRRSST